MPSFFLVMLCHNSSVLHWLNLSWGLNLWHNSSVLHWLNLWHNSSVLHWKAEAWTSDTTVLCYTEQLRPEPLTQQFCTTLSLSWGLNLWNNSSVLHWLNLSWGLNLWHNSSVLHWLNLSWGLNFWHNSSVLHWASAEDWTSDTTVLYYTEPQLRSEPLIQ
jgi:hypothetical protein